MKTDKSFFKREAVWTVLLGIAPITLFVLVMLIIWLVRNISN